MSKATVLVMISTAFLKIVGKVYEEELDMLEDNKEGDQDLMVSSLTVDDAIDVMSVITPEGPGFSATLIGKVFVNLGTEQQYAVTEIDKNSPLYELYFRTTSDIKPASAIDLARS